MVWGKKKKEQTLNWFSKYYFCISSLQFSLCIIKMKITWARGKIYQRKSETVRINTGFQCDWNPLKVISFSAFIGLCFVPFRSTCRRRQITCDLLNPSPPAATVSYYLSILQIYRPHPRRVKQAIIYTWHWNKLGHGGCLIQLGFSSMGWELDFQLN